ncbi:sensor histidine kinase [Aestuariibius sp. 2305UL40-4]|uniref:sensor histidine kinase n=1 Tax=Aestuariibius violaceus TaxID=3234132 RepID=UPI00345EAF3D
MDTRRAVENEDRLAALRSRHLLDTPRESDFDAIAALAAAICDAPIALISLVEDTRQWFKAAIGVDIRQTTIDRSICALAIRQSDLFVIPDTTADPRTADNPLVAGELHLRFYAGMPLTGADGLPLGTLCVLDTKPRTLSDVQAQTLRTLARQVMAQIDLRSALRNLADDQREIEHQTRRLTEALGQQDILRKEIDHRVKNSLQQVSALLGLQATEAGDGPLADGLREAQGRVRAIAEIHDQLHRSSTSATVDLSAYLDRLADILRSQARPGITLDLRSDPVEVPSRYAGSLALFVNEFVSNALKHAFPDDYAGRIDITFRHDSPYLRGVFRDNGPNKTDLASAAARPGLGLKVMQASAAQIGGTLRFDTADSGASATLEIPLDDGLRS